MSDGRAEFELPRKIEQMLHKLSRIYAHDGQQQLQQLIVNSRINWGKGWRTGDWDSEGYSHVLRLTVPGQLLTFSLKQLLALEEQLKSDLNSVESVAGEVIGKVSLVTDPEEDRDWRKNSGLLVSGKRTVPEDAERRIWGEEPSYRLFLSHISKFKEETSELKQDLEVFGISSFVAHRDIQASKEWQDEIELALASMDGFVALMTDGFHESSWTDQEVGFAFARRVPIIAVRLGIDPYGFIGKFQALSTSWEACPLEITKILIKHEKMFDTYVRALRRIHDFYIGNRLAEVLPSVDRLTDTQIDHLVAAYNENDDLRQCFAFNGKDQYRYGTGVLPHLKRLGVRNFGFDSSGRIQLKPI